MRDPGNNIVALLFYSSTITQILIMNSMAPPSHISVYTTNILQESKMHNIKLKYMQSHLHTKRK